MTRPDFLSGIVVDEVTLTVEELAQACCVETHWIVERVEENLLVSTGSSVATRRFTSAELVRARRLISIERDFDANPELAALVVDLIEEVDRLKARLAATKHL